MFMKDKKDFTTIEIKKTTRELLKQSGRMNENYDLLIWRLLKENCEAVE